MEERSGIDPENQQMVLSGADISASLNAEGDAVDHGRISGQKVDLAPQGDDSFLARPNLNEKWQVKAYTISVPRVEAKDYASRVFVSDAPAAKNVAGRPESKDVKDIKPLRGLNLSDLKKYDINLGRRLGFSPQLLKAIQKHYSRFPAQAPSLKGRTNVRSTFVPVQKPRAYAGLKNENAALTLRGDADQVPVQIFVMERVPFRKPNPILRIDAKRTHQPLAKLLMEMPKPSGKKKKPDAGFRQSPSPFSMSV
jgi:hypothetical protein